LTDSAKSTARLSRDVRITKMDIEHLVAVQRIEESVFKDPWPASAFIEVLALTPFVWVALADGAVAGYLITQWVMDEVHVLNVAVAKEMQRRGIAARLMRFIQMKARHSGMRDLFLEVRVSNSPAITLYQRFGFQALATRKKYYSDGEDALVMHCHLPDWTTERQTTEAADRESPLDNGR
jgi:[ribosomal protein S18]-alanine N-acetyltransferase